MIIMYANAFGSNKLENMRSKITIFRQQWQERAGERERAERPHSCGWRYQHFHSGIYVFLSIYGFVCYLLCELVHYRRPSVVRKRERVRASVWSLVHILPYDNMGHFNKLYKLYRSVCQTLDIDYCRCLVRLHSSKRTNFKRTF